MPDEVADGTESSFLKPDCDAVASSKLTSSAVTSFHGIATFVALRH